MALLFLLVGCVGEAASIEWKIDEAGRKVFFNVPSRNSIGRNDYLSYSERVSLYWDTIKEISSLYDVDPELVKAVIQVESNYNHRAVSRKGAKGLMQLMPGTALRYGVRSVFDPQQNIQGGVRYLKDLLSLFDSDLELALAAYNAGEKHVQRFNAVPNFVETRNYVRKVLALYNGETTYTPYASGAGTVRMVSYYKYVDQKGVTHYSADPVPGVDATKVSFSYAW
jgi:soluble lytic murein transglycosylase-like protein